MSKKRVFVIMPFSATPSATEAEWTETYDHIFSPAIESCGYACCRAQPGRGSLIASIIDELRAAPIVLADLTDRNPNVFYELGVRHALSKRTILVAQRYADVPSDLRGYWFLIYGRAPGEVAKFRRELRTLIDDIESNPEKSDSPVSDTLDRDNVSVMRALRLESAKKLTALHTEITEKLLLLQHGQPLGRTPCLELLRQTLYVDLGPEALRIAYEIEDTPPHLHLEDSHSEETQNRLAHLDKVVLTARGRLLGGEDFEPDTITTMVWQAPHSASSRWEFRCGRNVQVDCFIPHDPPQSSQDLDTQSRDPALDRHQDEEDS